MVQAVVDVVAPYVGDASKRSLSAILDKIELAVPYDLTLGAPGFNLGKLKGVFHVGIPSNLRITIATAFWNGRAGFIAESVRLANLQDNQTEQLLDLAISRILDQFPGVLGPDRWRSILALTLKQVSPWLDGSVWLEAVTFAATLELLKKEGADVQSYTSGHTPSPRKPVRNWRIFFAHWFKIFSRRCVIRATPSECGRGWPKTLGQ